MTKTSDGYIAVSEANEQIREALDSSIGFVKIKGEISSLVFHHTGHVYFSLKDDRAQLDGVIFKNMVKPEFSTLKKGDFVYALGTVTSYIKTGKISFQTYYISAKGQGNIHYDLTQLKEKLDQEGVFLPQKQFILPKIIKKLVVITSLHAAALKDFLSLIQNRTIGNTQIIVISALMQGEQTTESVIQGLKAARAIPDVQAVLITRGGGAYEDLWGFNSEILVRFIAQYPLPVVSAIGHEQDYTLVDFVAHKRYATPSAAAYDLFSYKQILQDQLGSFRQILTQNLSHAVEKLNYYLEYSKEQLKQNILYKFEQRHLQLEYLRKSLQQANPNTILQKGYAMILQHNQKPFSPSNTPENGDILLLQTIAGKIEVQVIQKSD